MGVDIFSELPHEKFEEGYNPSFTGLPVRKGRYEGVVQFQDQLKEWVAVNGTVDPIHYYTRLEAVTEGGRKVRGFTSTKPFKAGRDTNILTNSAVRLLRSLGKREEAVAAEGPVDLARALTTTIGDGIAAIIDVDWTAECKDCRLRGVKHSQTTPCKVYGEDNFPHDVEGNPSPNVECPTCGAELRANAEFKVFGALGS